MRHSILRMPQRHYVWTSMQDVHMKKAWNDVRDFQLMNMSPNLIPPELPAAGIVHPWVSGHYCALIDDD